MFDDIAKGLAIWAKVKEAKRAILTAEPNGAPVMIAPLSGLKLWGIELTLRMSVQRTR